MEKENKKVVEEVVKPEEKVEAPKVVKEKTTAPKVVKEEAKDVNTKIKELTDLVLLMAEKDKEKTEQIEMLISIADESRKDKFDAKKRVKIIPRVKLTTLNGKVIVGSKMMVDECYKDLSKPGNVYIENQVHKYTLEDGTTVDLRLPDYTRTYKKIEADVVAIKSIPEKEGENGEAFYRYTVKVLEDGRELELDYQYIN